uniref:Uncharacterized protein n=1 Tax=Rhizophora mucronata TaxID=61149 RepID=A0A2P2MYP0_RHIMU
MWMHRKSFGDFLRFMGKRQCLVDFNHMRPCHEWEDKQSSQVVLRNERGWG